MQTLPVLKTLLKSAPIWHFTSTSVAMSHKINACSVYTQQAYLRAASVSVAPHLRDQLNAKDADVTSLPN